MKQLFAALLLCLLPACAMAFDLSEYEIAESEGCHVSPLGSGLTLIRNPSYDIRIPDAARLAQGNEIIERITLPYDPEWQKRYDPFADAQGNLFAIGYMAELYGHNTGYTIYQVKDGELTRQQPIAGNPTALMRLRDRFIGLREEEGMLVTLLLYDEDNELLHELVLPNFHARLQSAQADGESTLVMLSLWDEENPRFEQSMLTLYIDASGQIAWQNQHAWGEPRTQVNYNCIFPDGQGGAFLLGSAAESYKIKSLRHIDRLGRITWTKECRADNAIFDIDAVIPNPNRQTVTCIGTVIANSRGLFDAFSMVLSLDGQMQSVDVRDFSARGDYNFSCMLAPDGTAYAVSDSATFQANSDKPCVAVPLADLPRADDPGIAVY